MKEPIEYISGEILEKCYGYAEAVLLSIKQAQKDAYNKAIDDAIDNATALVVVNRVIIDKESILKLKKL